MRPLLPSWNLVGERRYCDQLQCWTVLWRLHGSNWWQSKEVRGSFEPPWVLHSRQWRDFESVSTCYCPVCEYLLFNSTHIPIHSHAFILCISSISSHVYRHAHDNNDGIRAFITNSPPSLGSTDADENVVTIEDEDVTNEDATLELEDVDNDDVPNMSDLSV